MTKTEYVVYFTLLTPDGTLNSSGWWCDNLTDALAYAEKARQRGLLFVDIASQSVDRVGKGGVDTVADGKLPDGTVYDWNKNSRIGATKRR